jgi:hypothetical protein
MKRLTNSAISPVVTNAAEAVRGRLLGRAMGVPDFFVNRHLLACNHFLSVATLFLNIGASERPERV